MKELKFRAWDKRRNKYVNDFVLAPTSPNWCAFPYEQAKDLEEYQNYIHEKVGVIDEEWKLKLMGFTSSDYSLFDWANVYGSFNYEIEQFTGFIDTKKNEWYDGDILQPKNFSKRKWKQGLDERALIYWDNECAKFSLNFYSIYGGEGSSGDIRGQQLHDLLKEGWIKVGNKFENPELIHGTLKEKKKLYE